MSEANLYEALKALVEATEAADKPGDYGVSSEDGTMLKAREALKEYELEYSCARGFGYFRVKPSEEVAIRGKCIGNDATCPCQDGDMCHYRGPNPWPIPKTV